MTMTKSIICSNGYHFLNSIKTVLPNYGWQHAGQTPTTVRHATYNCVRVWRNGDAFN